MPRKDPYEYILILLIPPALRSAAASLAAAQSLNPGDDTPNFFSREVKNKITGVTEYYLARTIAYEDTVQAIPLLLPFVPGVLWHIEINVNDTTLEAALRLNLTEWLDTLGLELYSPSAIVE